MFTILEKKKKKEKRDEIGYNFKFDFERLKIWNNIYIFLIQNECIINK